MALGILLTHLNGKYGLLWTEILAFEERNTGYNRSHTPTSVWSVLLHLHCLNKGRKTYLALDKLVYQARESSLVLG